MSQLVESILTGHFRHTVTEAGRADGSATSGGRNSPRVFLTKQPEPLAGLERLLLVCAFALHVGAVALFIAFSVAGV